MHTRHPAWLAVQAEQHTALVSVVSKLAKQEAAAEKESAAAAARASSSNDAAGQLSVPASTNIAGNAAAALQQVMNATDSAVAVSTMLHASASCVLIN